MFKHCH